jgi:cation transport protein ChaC
MWVFGYGSLMWDRWEVKHGCTRRVQAELFGYRRTFNKASIKNWGTKATPCPTLNLEKIASGICCGTAFEFPDDHAEQIRACLSQREGIGFVLTKLSIRLDGGNYAEALVPLYEGANIIRNDTPDRIARMVLDARGGVHGSGEDYDAWHRQ